MSAGPARCWSPVPTARHPSGPRSTPVWSRPRRSTGRRSSPPRASARPDELHPVQRELAERGGSQCGYCTPGFVCSMAAEYYRADRTDGPATRRRTSTAQRVRPARPERQPVPLHRLPADPRRGVGARDQPDADDPLAGRRAAPAPPPGATRLDGPTRAAFAPTRRPRRRARAARRRTATPTVVAGCHRPRASRSTCAAPRPSYVVAVDRLPELRELAVEPTEVTDRRGAHAVRGRAPAWTARCRCSTRCGRSSRRG